MLRFGVGGGRVAGRCGRRGVGVVGDARCRRRGRGGCVGDGRLLRGGRLLLGPRSLAHRHVAEAAAAQRHPAAAAVVPRHHLCTHAHQVVATEINK